MSVKIQIVSSVLREQVGGLSEIAVEGTTVKAALDHLVQLHPALETKLFDNGVLRHHINIYVNDEDIRYLDDLDTPVKDAEIVALIPAVAGG